MIREGAPYRILAVASIRSKMAVTARSMPLPGR